MLPCRGVGLLSTAYSGDRRTERDCTEIPLLLRSLSVSLFIVQKKKKPSEKEKDAEVFLFPKVRSVFSSLFCGKRIRYAKDLSSHCKHPALPRFMYAGRSDEQDELCHKGQFP